MNKVRHVLGISGGKDSAALALYMKRKYPDLEIDYYTCDTGKELDETYELIKKLNSVLGKDIIEKRAASGSNLAPFDHHLTKLGGYLPSSNSRWCTKRLKLDPFEEFVGNEPTISYVGIRGDEDREGYISRKNNIQSIFPFRKNIWSEDVVSKVLNNGNLKNILLLFDELPITKKSSRFREILSQSLNLSFPQSQKLRLLIDFDVKLFNKLTFAFLKTTDYPLAKLDSFPLIDNDDVLVKDDIYRILEDEGVGIPAYYNEVEFEVNGQIGKYARSRSGCFFCFFQQKIEWIWLYEQHPEKFALAMEYEKSGYTWNEEETLSDLIQLERMTQIKEDFIKKIQKAKGDKKSVFLKDILFDSESEGCASCFI